MKIRLGAAEETTKREQPTAPNEWLNEIQLAIADAQEAAPFGEIIGESIMNADLFHFAPLVCMKFRGFDYRDEERRKKSGKERWQITSPTPILMGLTTD